MELHADPLQPAGLAQPLPFVLGAEGHVHRRQIERPAGLFQRGRQRGDRHAGIRMAQQPRTGHRTERRRDLQLRIVVAAGTFQRVRPAVVEHVFAVAVRLGVHRRHRHHLARLAAQHRVLRQPAGARIGRPAVLHRAQEGVADERIVRRRRRRPIRPAGTSAIFGCSVSVRVAEPSGMATSLVDLEHSLHLHGGIGGQVPARRSWCARAGRPRRTPPRRGRRRRSSPAPAG